MGGGNACAVIFDVDGVLLHLTPPEEQLFFAAFRDTYAVAETHLVADWNSYRKRNDVEIAREILERHFGRDVTVSEIDKVLDNYAASVTAGLDDGTLSPKVIDGAGDMLAALGRHDALIMGLATANLERAATARLKHTGLWGPFAVGGYAEALGPKTEILRQTIAQIGEATGATVPQDRIVFIGDQKGDLNAARDNGVAFIGHSPDAAQRDVLRDLGAETVVGRHDETVAIVEDVLGLR